MMSPFLTPGPYLAFGLQIKKGCQWYPQGNAAFWMVTYHSKQYNIAVSFKPKFMFLYINYVSAYNEMFVLQYWNNFCV